MFVENLPELLAPVDKKLHGPPLGRLSAARKQKRHPRTRGAVRGEPCGGKGS